MKASEVCELDPAQLDERLADLREELFNLRFQFATRQLTNTARIRQIRRDIARILTRKSEIGLVGGGSRSEAAGG